MSSFKKLEELIAKKTKNDEPEATAFEGTLEFNVLCTTVAGTGTAVAGTGTAVLGV